MYRIFWQFRLFLRKRFRKIPFCLKHIETHVKFDDGTNLCWSCTRQKIRSYGEVDGDFFLRAIERSSYDWDPLVRWAMDIARRKGSVSACSFVIGHLLIIAAQRHGTNSTVVTVDAIREGPNILEQEVQYIEYELSMQHLNPLPII